MKKVLSLITLLGLSAFVYAAEATASFEFYKQQANALPIENTRQNRNYAASIAQNLDTWIWQNAEHASVQDALLLQAGLYLKARKNADALVTLFRLKKLFPQTDAAALAPMFDEATASLEKNKAQTATALFAVHTTTTSADRASLEAEALYALSKLSGKDFYAPAAKAFENFFIRFPQYKESDKIELLYGDLHRANGNYLAAILQYKKAGELYPDTPYKAASIRLMGDIYADNLKDTSSALAQYTRVLRDFEGSSETGVVYKHMAILDENNKQYESALINYDKAIELLGTADSAYEAYHGKADVYHKTKEYAQAYDTLLKTAGIFAKNEKKHTDTLIKAAEIAQRKMRDDAKYTTALEKALFAYPQADKAADIMFDLAYSYEKQGKTAQAKEMYKKLIIAFPTHRLASRAQGRIAKLEK